MTDDDWKAFAARAKLVAMSDAEWEALTDKERAEFLNARPPESAYRRLALVILAVEVLDEPPMHRVTLENLDEQIPCNIGDLTDGDDQRLSAKCGIPTELWAKLNEEQRIPWMELTVATMAEATGVSVVNSSNARRAVEAFIGPEVSKILEIVRSEKSADNKMQSICAIDRRYLGWNSEQWADALGVKGGAIRKTSFWKKCRENEIEKDR